MIAGILGFRMGRVGSGLLQLSRAGSGAAPTPRIGGALPYGPLGTASVHTAQVRPLAWAMD